MVMTLLLPTKIGLGLKVQVTLVVPVAHARVIAPVKVVGPCAWMLKVVEVAPISAGFWLRVVAGGEVSEKEAVPIPVRATVWGLPVAVSAIFKLPLRVPVAVGEKTTLITQLCPGLRMSFVAKQVLVSLKSVVVVVMLVIFSVEMPVLVMVTGWGGLVVPTP